MKNWSLAILILLSPLANAREIYSFLKSDCSLVSGVVINIRENNIHVLQLNGEFAKVKADQVDALFLFNYVENPIEKIVASEALLQDLHAVYADESDSPSFYAWPIKFVESLVIFYDVEGRIHVHELESIVKLRPVANWNEVPVKIKNFKSISLNHAEVSARCPGLTKSKDQGVRPTRTISDKIKVRQYLEDFEKNYDNLAGYQERTYLYARPFLYDPKTRFGLVFFDKKLERDDSVVPLFVQWSSGRPYRFQSFTSIGGQVSEFAPRMEPSSLIRTDVKAHIFHAHFTGNLMALPAGTPYYIKFTDIEQPDRKDSAAYGNIEMQSSLNYIALMGGDWGPWSISFGYYYPIYVLRLKNEVREILSSQTSYMTRVMFTRKNWRLRGVFSPQRYKRSNPSMEDMPSAGSQGEKTPSDYLFESYFFRGGLDLTTSVNSMVSLDAMTQVGRYDETMNSTKNYFSFKNQSFAATIRYDFSNYVSMQALGIYSIRKYDATFFSVREQKTLNEFRYGGAFAFIF